MSTMLRRLITPLALIAALIGLSLSVPARAQAAPETVASIKPIASLVAGVMQGVGAPHLIVPGGASPHSYSLKPSDAAALAKAKVVFWVGPHLEFFLTDPLKALAGNAKVVALGDVEGLTLLKNRTGGLWEEHTHEHEHVGEHAHEEHSDHGHDHEGDHAHDHDHHHDHDHGEYNPHIWLDPQNAKIMVGAIAKALSEADPVHKEIYARNAARLSARLDALTKDLSAELRPVRGRPFIVFHDAYAYLEHRFGLKAVGSITLSPELAPGAARIGEIRRKIRRGGVVCVFSEPQFPPKIIAVLIAGTSARAAALDPLGADIPDGEELYFTLLKRNAAALKDCLGAQS